MSPQELPGEVAETPLQRAFLLSRGGLSPDEIAGALGYEDRKALVRHLHFEEGVSKNQLSKALLVSISTVWRWMDDANRERDRRACHRHYHQVIKPRRQAAQRNEREEVSTAA